MRQLSTLTHLAPALLSSLCVFGALSLAGCGVGTLATGVSPTPNASSSINGILHGDPSPIIGANVTLYTTTSAAYGSAATLVASTTTDSNGFFGFTLPTTSVACPAGEFAYVVAYGGNAGSGTNNNILLMSPIGACSSLYSYTTSGSGGSTVYENTYSGSSVWVDELTTAVSAYALGNFITFGSGGVVNISAPANNHSTSSATTPAAAGLAHAFANAMAIMNVNTGQPNAFYTPFGGTATTGIVPDAEIEALGNILQACVNSAGVTGSNTATSNDGSLCGKLFSLTTPPQSGATPPSNTLQAMVDLAKYPNPQTNWNAGCTAPGSVNTATDCIFGLAASSGAYPGALASAPPDWALAVVYPAGTGVVTGSGCSSTCPGLTYPFYVALDYEDNVYVLNYDSYNASSPFGANNYTNILGFTYAGSPIFSSAEDSTNKTIATIGTDTAGHVFGANSATPSVLVYSTTSGSKLTTVTTGLGAKSALVQADPLNNIIVASSQSSINLRKLTYTASPLSYSAAAIEANYSGNGNLQIGLDSNLDIYLLTTSPAVYIQPNTGTSTAPTYATTGFVAATGTLSGNTNNAYGLGVTSAGNAYVFDSAGATKITKTGSQGTSAISYGSATTLPAVPLPSLPSNTTLYNRGVFIDGSDWAYSPDGANGSTPSGITVYDSADNLALGTYKGCYVTSKVCNQSTTTTAMYSPRGAAIDSSGDIWVVSGASANLTELIGAAAPTWPALSMAKFGKPQ